MCLQNIAKIAKIWFFLHYLLPCKPLFHNYCHINGWRKLTPCFMKLLWDINNSIISTLILFTIFRIIFLKTVTFPFKDIFLSFFKVTSIWIIFIFVFSSGWCCCCWSFAGCWFLDFMTDCALLKTLC